jgi:PAS domain S-box-containing protein
MTLTPRRRSWQIANPDSSFQTAILICLVALLSFLIAKVGGALVLRPQMLWPLWPGCAFLVAILLLMPRRIWPMLIAAGLAGFVVYDLQVGLTLRSIAFLILSDTVEILVVALGVSYAFDGLPRLNSVKSLARYSFFAVILAPLTAAFVATGAFGGNYWLRWRISFFTEALALLTLTPAILSWANTIQAWRHRSRSFYFEAAALVSGLGLLGYFAFVTPERTAPSVAAYSLLPFLVWATLRFGLTGITSSMVAVAFLSIWGAVHGSGPFTRAEPLKTVLSLQLFLFFVASTFMVLAVLVEAQKQTVRAFRESEKRFRLVADTAPVLIWMAETDKLCTYFNKPWLDFTGRSLDREFGNGWAEGVHPEDLKRCMDTYTGAFDRREEFRTEYRLRRHDGEYRWILDIGVPRFSQDDSFIGYIGVGIDVTERKQAEEGLSRERAELSEAQHLARVGSWEWNPEGDEVTWSEELYRIAGRDPSLPAASFKEHAQLYTAESFERLRLVVEEALRSGTPYELDLEMIRSDGMRRGIRARGEAQRDATGRVVRLRGTAQDITERRLQEEELRGSEERFRLAAQAGRMFAYAWDASTDEIARSAEAAKILGIDETGRTTGQQIMAAVHPDDRERLSIAVAALTAENPDLQIRYRMLRPDGSVVWLERTSRAYFDRQGMKLLRVVGMVVDITDRKRAEEALRESEARERARAKELETVLNLVPVPVLIAYDAECRWMTGNRAAREQLHVAEGRNFSASAEFGERPAFRQLQDGVEIPPDLLPMQQAAATGSPVHGRLVTTVFEDGTKREELASAVPLLDEEGRPRGAVGTSIDLTEMRQAEQAVRESEDRLRLILDSTAEAIYGIDIEHRCTFCNPACLRTLGYERVDEVLGKNMHELTHHTRADGTPFPVEECRVHRVIRTGEGEHAEDEEFWKADRTRFPVEYWSYPQRRGGQVVGGVVAFIDITQRKLAEAAVANVSRRLIEAQEQERTRIARELHDDIGQRLALMAVELEQLRQDFPSVPEFPSRIGELQKQATEIATDIQTLSHELHSAKLEYLGIAAAMRGFCREFGEQAKVKVEFKSHDLPKSMSPDISLCLFRVLQEALHNSVKHSGVRNVEVGLWATPEEIHLSIRDSGAGFDSKATKESRGLGLTSMEERLKLLKGTLSVESQPKRGTTVHARVPLVSGGGSLRAAG